MIAAGCSGSVSIGGDSVKAANDVSVGECITVTDSSDGKVEAKKVACDTTDSFAFFAAATVSGSGQCAGSQSTLTFENGGDKLCLTPNLAQGKCYQLPTGGTGSLTDYKQVDCGTTAPTGAAVVEVVTRANGNVTCASGLETYDFTQPQSIVYCLRVS